MKTRFSSPLRNLPGFAAMSAALGLALSWCHAADPARLNIDNSPLKAEIKAATSFAPIVKKAAPSVVNIFTTKRVRVPRQDLMPFFNDPFFRRFLPDEYGQQGRRQPETRQERNLGSGVIVTEDGYILTNDHVVDGADEIEVAVGEDRKEYKAKVVGKDSKTDVAVLKIEATGLPALTIADSDQLEVGDTVLAIGNPFGLSQTVTIGIVSALGRGIGIEDYEDFIQTDAAVNPGNSGGALVDAQGRLVGINTAILSRSGGSQGIGFAIPSNMARAIMDLLITEGKVSRGYLGISIQDLSPALAKEFDLAESGGALVGDVSPDGAGDQAGLKNGDVITEFNGQPVRDSRTLRLRVAGTPPGSSVKIKVLRDGKELSLTAKLKSLPEDLASTASPRGEDEILKEVGVTDITPETRRQFDIPEEIDGALIASVEPESPAYEAGLRPGDVILEINRKSIKNAEAAVAATRSVKDKTVLLRVWSQGGIRFLVVDESKEK